MRYQINIRHWVQFRSLLQASGWKVYHYTRTGDNFVVDVIGTN